MAQSHTGRHAPYVNKKGDSMSKYINRNSLGIDYANPDAFVDPMYAAGWNNAVKIIKNAPAADVSPTKHAYWTLIDNDKCKCSRCDTISRISFYSTGSKNFCPNCGAMCDLPPHATQHNNLFQKIPIMGNLYFHHTYLFYDEPLIFSCTTASLRYYLMIAEPSGADKESWLIIPVSEDKLHQAEKSQMLIRDLIYSEHTVYLAVKNENDMTITPLNPLALNDSMLPRPDARLKYTDIS